MLLETSPERMEGRERLTLQDFATTEDVAFVLAMTATEDFDPVAWLNARRRWAPSGSVAPGSQGARCH